jgi:hypothetical protein
MQRVSKMRCKVCGHEWSGVDLPLSPRAWALFYSHCGEAMVVVSSRLVILTVDASDNLKVERWLT